MLASQIIKAAIAQVLADAQPIDLRIPSAFGANLIFLYHTMRASENLLRVAIEHTEPGKLRDYFVEHLEEETGHAEWLAKDLSVVGIDAASTVVPRFAVEIVGSQYYLIQHIGSSALLGYMVLMECFPMKLSDVDMLEATHGIELMRTIRFHAEHDVDHGESLLEIIDGLTEQQQALAMESGVQAARYLVCAIANFR